jgi:VanZ like family
VRRLVATLHSHWLSLLWLVVILLVTLVPLEPPDQMPRRPCTLCGEGGVADGALNAALFLPLGAALSMAGWRRVAVLASGAFLSLGVESAQLLISGRDPNLADFVFNTMGTVLGIALARSASTWWRPERRLANILSLSAAIGSTSVVVLTGILLRPAFPEETYYGGWTPHFGHLERYDGRLLAVSLDGLEVSSGLIARSAETRQQLLSGATLDVRARAGQPPPSLAPLLTIHDRHQRELLLVGVEVDDLIYRYRTRAIAWGLGASEIRVGGALRGIASRDTFSVVVRQAHPGRCVRVNAMEHCGLGYTMGSGWALLLSGQPLTTGLRSALNILWASALFSPAGLWARGGPVAAATAAFLAAGLLIVPPMVGLLPTPGVELVGALVGVLAGSVLGRSALVLRTRPTRLTQNLPGE